MCGICPWHGLRASRFVDQSQKEQFKFGGTNVHEVRVGWGNLVWIHTALVDHFVVRPKLTHLLPIRMVTFLSSCYTSLSYLI